jgi:HAD superfamily hydrolase (TIGR01484 family)
MIPSLDRIDPKVVKNFLAVIFDIDDTFTTQGKITAAAFQALWQLKEHRLNAVPITGRPAGWCDHIARMWPVDGVVGENGAFYFWFDEKESKLRKRFLDSEAVRAEKKERLLKIREEILTSIPGTAVASDQTYREADLAIDYCEDVAPLDRKAIDRICEIFKKHGAAYKVSSIHVNGWFGDYDKLEMLKIYIEERWKLDLETNRERFLFCGDSPNDEPLFEFFPHTVGVKNILRFTDQMTHLPTYMTEKEGGEGFAEVVTYVLGLRSG